MKNSAEPERAAYKSRLWVLGASDPEMERIEALLRESGEAVVHATAKGARCRPDTAYECAPVPTGTHFVECAPTSDRPQGAVSLDHHRKGDYGYGRGPWDFFVASSIGQVVRILALDDLLPWPKVFLHDLGLYGTRGALESGILGPNETRRWFIGSGSDARWGYEIPLEVCLTAAGDHCPAAAYLGKCPGIAVGALMEHRARQQAAFQKRPVEDVLREVHRAMNAILAARTILLGGVGISDLRDAGTVPSLPEASLRLNRPVLYRLSVPGGVKVGLLGAGEGTEPGPAPVEAFLRGEGPAAKLVRRYGDPARGYAGGYEA